MNDPNGQGEHDHPGDQSGIIVFGGGRQQGLCR